MVSFLYPYGFSTAEVGPDHLQFVKLTRKMERAIEKVNGMNYKSSQSADFYPASGTSDDWFYGEDLRDKNGGIRPYSLCIELRDKGKRGFEILPKYIIPTGEEILPSLYIFIDTAIESPLCYDECPTPMPSPSPTQSPSTVPSNIPSGVPSIVPSFGLSSNPSSVLSVVPTAVPAIIPSGLPSIVPSSSPPTNPSSIPSDFPTPSPSTAGPSFGATTILSAAPSSPRSCIDTTSDVKLVKKGNKSCAQIRENGYCKIKVKNEGGKKAKDFCPAACSMGNCVNCVDQTGRVKLVEKGKKTCAQIRQKKLCKEKVKITGRPKAKTLCPTACSVDGCKLSSSDSSSRPSTVPSLSPSACMDDDEYRYKGKKKCVWVTKLNGDGLSKLTFRCNLNAKVEGDATKLVSDFCRATCNRC